MHILCYKRMYTIQYTYISSILIYVKICNAFWNSVVERITYI